MDRVREAVDEAAAPSRSYRGVPADERRQARRHALVEAALDCLHEAGQAGIGVRAVCARARLTPRYFYQSFADLDELLTAAVDAASDEVSGRVLAAVAAAGPDTADQVRAAVSTGFGIVADDPRTASVFLVAASGHGPLADRRHEVVARYAELVLTNIAALNSVRPADRARASATALFLMGGTTDVMEAVLTGRLALSRERVVDLLTGMWLGALAASVPAERQRASTGTRNCASSPGVTASASAAASSTPMSSSS